MKFKRIYKRARRIVKSYLGKNSFYPAAVVNPLKSVYDISVTGNDGSKISIATFKGKYILLVNVASYCGYTYQYSGLQKLHEKYHDRLVVIGIPCNDFGSQEPGNNDEIKFFCTENYNVTFFITEKVSILGDDRHPLYNWLSDKRQNGWNDQLPVWNFCKYLITPEGKLAAYWNQLVKPTDNRITGRIN